MGIKLELDIWYEAWDSLGSRGLDTWFDLRNTLERRGDVRESSWHPDGNQSDSTSAGSENGGV